MRAVVDTNIWISASITPDGHSSRIVAAAITGQLQPIFCEATLTEFKNVFTRPRLVAKYTLKIDDLNELIRLFTTDGELVADPPPVQLARDHKDDLFIALAIEARVDYLVTRDDDLKDDPAVRDHLAAYGVSVVSIREFVALLDASPE